jgi:hypothetical protein
MSLLVKKIEKSKWLQNDIMNGEDISADAITNCMKTKNNTLSMWRIDDEKQIDEAVLAIVSAHQHLDTFDVVWVNVSQLEEYGIGMQDTPGITPIDDLVDRHVDIVNLTYRSLGKVANCIVKCFSDSSLKRYTYADLKKILKRAIKSGRLEVERIAPSVSEKLT